MSLFRLRQDYCSESWSGYICSVSKIGSISCQQLYRTHNSNSTNMEQEIEITAMYQELRYGQLSGSREPAKHKDLTGQAVWFFVQFLIRFYFM